MNKNINILSKIIKSAINEAFDFNEISNDEDDVFGDVLKEVNTYEYYCQYIRDNKISIKNILTNTLNFQLNAIYPLASKWYKEIPELSYSKFADPNRQISSTVLKQTLDYNGWISLRLKDAMNSEYTKHALEFIFDDEDRQWLKKHEISPIRYSINFAKQSRETNIDEYYVYLSPDKGMMCLFCTQTCPQEDTLFRYHSFLFTGKVNYKKQKEKSLSVINDATYKWMEKLLKQHGSLCCPKNNLLLRWKDGYPQLYSFISKTTNLYRVLPAEYYKSFQQQYLWTSRLPVKHPNVLLRKNTLDNTIELGIFYPWDISSFANSEQIYIYGRPTCYWDKPQTEGYKHNPNEFGIIVYQLGEEGKRLFDIFKNNNYINKSNKNESN